MINTDYLEKVAKAKWRKYIDTAVQGIEYANQQNLSPNGLRPNSKEFIEYLGKAIEPGKKFKNKKRYKAFLKQLSGTTSTDRATREYLVDPAQNSKGILDEYKLVKHNIYDENNFKGIPWASSLNLKDDKTFTDMARSAQDKLKQIQEKRVLEGSLWKLNPNFKDYAKVENNIINTKNLAVPSERNVPDPIPVNTHKQQPTNSKRKYLLMAGAATLGLGTGIYKLHKNNEAERGY